jgi:type III restriction enzyme
MASATCFECAARAVVKSIEPGGGDLLNLVIEVTGEGRKDKAAKVAAARTLWVPAVNNHGGFGRWEFVEVTDPWDAVGVIRGAVVEAMARV